MNGRTSIILALTGLGLVAALVIRAANQDDGTPAPAPASATPVDATSAPMALPRLVELGSDSCQSCKAMFPVLAELRAAHPTTLSVEFIDVWKHPDAAEPYKIRLIPSQILFAPDGRELARHEGFFPADAIRARFRALGFPLDGAAPAAPAAADGCDAATAPCEG